MLNPGTVCKNSAQKKNLGCFLLIYLWILKGNPCCCRGHLDMECGWFWAGLGNTTNGWLGFNMKMKQACSLQLRQDITYVFKESNSLVLAPCTWGCRVWDSRVWGCHVENEDYKRLVLL